MISYILQFLCLFSPCLWLFIPLFVNYICTLRVQHKNSPPDSTETSGGLLTVMVFFAFSLRGIGKIYKLLLRPADKLQRLFLVILQIGYIHVFR